MQIEHLVQSAGGSVGSALVGGVCQLFDSFPGKELAISLGMVGGINQCCGHS